MSSNHQSVTYFHKTPSDVNKLLIGYLKPYVSQMHLSLSYKQDCVICATYGGVQKTFTEYMCEVDFDIMIDNDNSETHTISLYQVIVSDGHDPHNNCRYHRFYNNMKCHDKNMVTHLYDEDTGVIFKWIYDQNFIVIQCRDKVVRKFSKEISNEISRLFLSTKDDIDKFEAECNVAHATLSTPSKYKLTKTYVNE